MARSREGTAPMSEIVGRARSFGLDLAATGSRVAYDGQVDAPHRLRGDPAWSVVLVLGNTKAIWGPFVRWLADDEARLAAPHPLDDYVAQAVAAAVGSAGPVEVHWLHDRATPVLSAARLAAVSGLASAGPAGLSAHEIYGPWLALRAALLLPGPPPIRAEARAPCAGCAAPCAETLTVVLAEQAQSRDTVDHRAVAQRWRSWVSVRDACPVGREWRYEARALAYHYTKDPRHLHALVAAHRSGGV